MVFLSFRLVGVGAVSSAVLSRARFSCSPSFAGFSPLFPLLRPFPALAPGGRSPNDQSRPFQATEDHDSLSAVPYKKLSQLHHG